MVGRNHFSKKYLAMYNIVRHKGDTLQKVMETSSSSTTFRRDLIGPRLDSWNEMLKRLASVQLVHGSDEFCWRVTKNGVLSVDSMYKALIKLIQPIITNKSIRNMNISLNTKVFQGTFGVVLFLLTINLQIITGMDKKYVFCHEEETIIIQIGSTLYPP
jgi:hypothetical protein